MKNVLLASAAIAIFASTACTKKEEAAAPEDPDTTVTLGEADDDAENLAAVADKIAALDTDAPPASGDERLFGKKEFTIISKQTGAETGDITEHVREWGRLRAEIKNTSISVAGFTQESSQRSISEGAKMVNVDNATGNVTTMENPLYDSIVARMKGKSGVDFGKEMMAQMGGRATGEKGKFAGHDCEYWEVANLSTKTCITPWGGTLHTLTNMAGMSIEKMATEVKLGDGGPDEAFTYDASKATAVPDLADIMKRAREGLPAEDQE